jgi:hypothetical protein
MEKLYIPLGYFNNFFALLYNYEKRNFVQIIIIYHEFRMYLSKFQTKYTYELR